MQCRVQYASTAPGWYPCHPRPGAAMHGAGLESERAGPGLGTGTGTRPPPYTVIIGDMCVLEYWHWHINAAGNDIVPDTPAQRTEPLEMAMQIQPSLW